MVKAFPDQKFTATNAWGIDGFGIIEHTMTGTFKGPFGPVRPTGKPVTGWHQVDVIQPTADGKIQHGWGYMNVLEMMSEAGAVPKGGPAAQPAKGQAKAAAAGSRPSRSRRGPSSAGVPRRLSPIEQVKRHRDAAGRSRIEVDVEEAVTVVLRSDTTSTIITVLFA